MTALKVKICGLKTAESVDAAVDAGADMIGLMFYPPSPRAVSAAEAHQLATRIPPSVARVGVFVAPEDSYLQEILAQVPLDWLQLHGNESPARSRQIAAHFDKRVMKAFRLRNANDLAPVTGYENAANQLLFDAKPPENMADTLPGGNGVAFDWTLLKDFRSSLPWMLSGGLTSATLAEAVRVTGAHAVDVSSGVEDRPGVKNLAAIRQFITAAKNLPHVQNA